MTRLVAFLAFCLAFPFIALPEETIVRSIGLPGASLDQEVTYHPTRADYEAARDEVLRKLRAGDPSARVNPAAGPWMRAETTAMIGFAVKGIGASEGRKDYRQISAAEEALFLFENTNQ